MTPQTSRQPSGNGSECSSPGELASSLTRGSPRLQGRAAGAERYQREPPLHDALPGAATTPGQEHKTTTGGRRHLLRHTVPETLLVRTQRPGGMPALIPALMEEAVGQETVAVDPGTRYRESLVSSRHGPPSMPKHMRRTCPHAVHNPALFTATHVSTEEEASGIRQGPGISS